MIQADKKIKSKKSKKGKNRKTRKNKVKQVRKFLNEDMIYKDRNRDVFIMNQQPRDRGTNFIEMMFEQLKKDEQMRQRFDV